LRYPVENILEWLAGGMIVQEILSDYEDLAHDYFLAVLSYAARLALLVLRMSIALNNLLHEIFS
jgi:uncharacterized protein (DUF433 family)